MDAEQKRGRYGRIRGQLGEVLTVTEALAPRMATVVALLHHKMDYFFWTGFYQLVDGKLLVVCYQGPLACQDLQKERGACWAAVEQKKTIVVENVDEFEGHIACDARSKSEVVVPCLDKEGNVFAVLDVDSNKLNSFDEVDAEELEKIVALL
ncbi:MAG: GAF domain-containing protein [Planctomycetes bacterium]|nr:GAF domain-containing protein [Planctomycetota bacterium]